MKPKNKKSEAAQMLGSLGGKARAKALAPEERKAIAKKAGKAGAEKRWGKKS